MTLKVNIIVLRCHDLAACKSFYESLGCTFTQEQHGTSPIHYAAHVNGIIFELYPSTHATPDHTRLGFYSDQVTQQTILTDPDGRKVELIPNIDECASTP